MTLTFVNDAGGGQAAMPLVRHRARPIGAGGGTPGTQGGGSLFLEGRQRFASGDAVMPRARIVRRAAGRQIQAAPTIHAHGLRRIQFVDYVPIGEPVVVRYVRRHRLEERSECGDE
jgi:hypothetical protein